MSVAQLLQADQSRGLITSPPRRYPSLRTVPTRTDEILMILNQGAFFKDDRPTETYQQAADFLEKKERSSTALEDAESEYMSSDIDPAIYDQLEAEAVRTGSNVFAHTSQDFVEQVIKGIKRYQKEARLYSGNVTFTAQDPTVQRTAEQNKTGNDEQTQQTQQTQQTREQPSITRTGNTATMAPTRYVDMTPPKDGPGISETLGRMNMMLGGF